DGSLGAVGSLLVTALVQACVALRVHDVTRPLQAGPLHPPAGALEERSTAPAGRSFDGEDRGMAGHPCAGRDAVERQHHEVVRRQSFGHETRVTPESEATVIVRFAEDDATARPARLQSGKACPDQRTADAMS